MSKFERTKEVYIGREFVIPYSIPHFIFHFGYPDSFNIGRDLVIDYYSFKSDQYKITFSTIQGEDLYASVKDNDQTVKEESEVMRIIDLFINKGKVIAPFFKYN